MTKAQAQEFLANQTEQGAKAMLFAAKQDKDPSHWSFVVGRYQAAETIGRERSPEDDNWVVMAIHRDTVSFDTDGNGTSQGGACRIYPTNVCEGGYAFQSNGVWLWGMD